MSFYEDLVHDFPDQFEQIRGGCECGPGWAGIIREVCQSLAGTGVKWTCIKEKYASLRMYTDSVPAEHADKVYDALEIASVLSFITCETCGQPGMVRDDLSWWRTLCDADYAKAKETQA